MSISPFMQAAVDAAEAVRGTTSPNPWVGAVVASEGQIVARGATSPPGGMHAEAAALVGQIPAGSTLYATLEPCAPFEGKRTPPCSARAIEAGIAKVVVALEDPDPRVRGRGIAAMREAGIEVEVGDGRDEVVAQLRPYLKHRQAGRPYVIAKFAASLDGRTSANTGDSKWITGEAARDRSHQERAKVDAILVGSGTVLADDPALTARPGGVLAGHQPVRVILDGRGRVPASAQVFRQPGHTIVATSQDAPAEWKRDIVAAGATIIDIEHGPAGVNLEQLLPALARRGILSIWAEGGATTLGSLFDGDHVDEAWAFLAPKIIGGRGNPAVAGAGIDLVADAAELRSVRVQQAGDDVWIRGYAGSWEYRD